MSWLDRMDRWNQRSIERANERFHLAAEIRELEHRHLERPDGRTVHVQVLPTGFPVNDYEYLDVVIIPVWWLYRRLRHPGGYQVVVSRAPGRWGARDRVLYRGPSVTRAHARTQVEEVARRFSS